MNNISLIGRLTKDPEIRYSAGNEPIAFGSYTLAVDRPKNRKGETVTDFLKCKVVGKRAEFAEKHLKKGMKIAVTGRMQADPFEDKNGNRRVDTYVQISAHYFCESSGSGRNAAPGYDVPHGREQEDFTPIEDEIEGDEDLPF